MVSPSFGSRMFDHQPHDAARGVELAGLLVGGVGELLDQVFVGLAEDVRAAPPGCRAADAREVLDQVLEQRVGEPLLVGPLRHRRRCRRACRGWPSRSRAWRAAAPARRWSAVVAHVAPVAAFGNLEAVDLGKQRVLLVAAGLCERRRRTPRPRRREMRLKNSSGKM